MNKKDVGDFDFENPETCPNCGQYVGDESCCPYCGAVLYNEEEMNEFEDEGEEL